MKVVWTRPALRQLGEAREYIAIDNPEAASRQIDLIEKSVSQLAIFPMMGRTGMRAGTREFPVTGTPYILVYRIAKSSLQILTVLHGARNWKAQR